jgi:(S)-2-hydroxyglutarate dehydrogenase
VDLYERGVQNGIEGLEILDAAGIREREPYCRGIRAIFSPVTGIVDFGTVARSFAADILASGADVFTRRDVCRIRRTPSSVLMETNAGEYEARHMIACAGLQADRVAKMTGGASDPKIVPFRGDYLILKADRRHLVRGNIYPVPDPNFPFLGVHFTPRMDGEIWLGPNAVLAFAREGYAVTSVDARDLLETLTYPGFVKLARRHFATGVSEMYRDLMPTAYVGALQRYIPELSVDNVLPGPSGVRAQAMTSEGATVDDFVFEGDAGVLHVRNAPSPAATSSLAIARYIADDAAARFDLTPTAAAL